MAKRPIFISHSRSNDEWTFILVKTLKEAGYEVWYDEIDLKPGMEIEQTISDNLKKKSDILVIIIPEAQSSEWVHFELLKALASNKRIIPVLRVQTKLEGLLRNRQVIDVIDLDGFTAAQRIIGALNVLSFDPEPPKRTKAVKIFISHSSKDNEFTKQLVNDLQLKGASVWVDMEQIPHGDFYQRINEGLSKSNWFILVVTAEALKSKIIEMEVNAAFGLTNDKQMKGIIPIIAKPFEIKKMPPMWRQLQRYDATNDYQNALTGVLKALGLSQ